MNWALAIDLNRAALVRVMAALFAAAGLAPGGADAASLSSVTLPRHVRSALLRILRPAEAALRRLLVIQGFLMAREGRGPAAPAPVAAPAVPLPRGGGARVPAFAVFDPLRQLPFGPKRTYPGAVPRICVPGFSEPVFVETRLPSAADLLDAGRLCLRLEALRRALDDLPGQARRLARRQSQLARSTKPGRCLPLRLGRPPGYRKRPVHEVDDILRECHALARDALEAPDTS